MENQKQYYNLLIAKKTEKLVTAIYLISQFLKDTESIKIEIRTEANKLLKNIHLLAFNENRDAHSLYKECLDSVSLLISFLVITRDTNLISKMNSEIVIDSLRMLENILIKKQFQLSKEHLMIVEEELFTTLAGEKKNEIVNRNTSFDVLTERNVKFNLEDLDNDTNKNISKNLNLKIESGNPKFIKDKIYKGQNIKDKINNNQNSNNQALPNLNIKKASNSSISNNKSKQTKDRKENRRDQILGLFSKGVEVSINDISKKIVGYSVKTIQRELNDLVMEEKLKKIGDKRWSKYILNN